MSSNVFFLGGATWRLGWLWLLVAIAGCGASDELKREPVSGMVTLNGKPCSGLTVTFIPMGSTPGIGVSGCTDQDGKYELSTTSGGKGAPVGEYRVAISKLVRPDGSSFPAGMERGPADPPVFPVQYRGGPGQNELTATVAIGPNTINYQLSAKYVPPAFLRHQ